MSRPETRKLRVLNLLKRQHTMCILIGPRLKPKTKAQRRYRKAGFFVDGRRTGRTLFVRLCEQDPTRRLATTPVFKTVDVIGSTQTNVRHNVQASSVWGSPHLK